MKYLQIKFCLQPDTEIVRDVLTDIAAAAGCDSFIDIEGVLMGYAPLNVFDEMVLVNSCKSFPIPETKVSFTVERVEDKNWNETWENNGFEPIIFEDRCIIYCSKDIDRVEQASINQDKGLIYVEIDPKQAFGSGEHATTQMIVGHLLELDLKGKNILDCGCGTGILSIVAAKKKANIVCAYDIDEWSVENTLHNAKLNNVSIQVLEGDREVISKFNETFDIVLANINRNILLNDLDTFVKYLKPCGMVVLSGFYKDDKHLLIEAAEKLGLVNIKTYEYQDWCCLVFQQE